MTKEIEPIGDEELSQIEHGLSIPRYECWREYIDDTIKSLIIRIRNQDVENEILTEIIGTIDEQLCCDGRDCGCHGATNAQKAEHDIRKKRAYDGLKEVEKERAKTSDKYICNSCEKHLSSPAEHFGTVKLKNGGVGSWPLCGMHVQMAMVAGWFPFYKVGTTEAEDFLQSAEINYGKHLLLEQEEGRQKDGS